MLKKLKIVSVVVSALMTFTGVAVLCANPFEERLEEETEIAVDGVTTKTLKAELSGFYPGNEQTYIVRLTGDEVNSYYVTVDFRDEDGGELGNYLTVKISTAEFTLEKTLKELLDGDPVSVGQNASEIQIAYTMPEDIGNESQGTTVDFLVEVTAKK